MNTNFFIIRIWGGAAVPLEMNGILTALLRKNLLNFNEGNLNIYNICFCSLCHCFKSTYCISLLQHSTHSEGTKRNRIQSVDSDIEGSPRPFDPANPNTPKMQVGCSSYNQHRLRALTFQRLLTILHLLCLGIIDRIYYHYY